MENSWDCIVVGAGAAGLSAALVLGRARQRTLVVDAGEQSNRDAHGIGGLLGYDRRPPAEFYAAGWAELAAYPSVELRSGGVLGGHQDDAGFVLELADGSRELARRVLLATGMEYRYPGLPGIAERWGRSVFHCPFCHGWEVRDRVLGVLDRGAAGMHRALLLRAWSDDVTLFADGSAELDAEDAERLRAAGVTVDERRVGGLVGPDATLTPSPSPTAASARATGSSCPSPCISAPTWPSSSARRSAPQAPSPPRPSRSTRSIKPACRPLRRRRRELEAAVGGERGGRGLLCRGHDRRRLDD